MEPITQALALECAKKFAQHFESQASSFLGDWVRKKKAEFPVTYKGYILKVAEKYSHVRTFFDRENGRYIYDFYVPSSIYANSKIIHNPTIDVLSKERRLYVLTGQGGSGKSMFMRHLLITSLLNYVRVPIFIELRNHSREKLPLTQIISNTVNELGLDLNADQVGAALKQGVFNILLDGFDELNAETRQHFQREIQAIASKSESFFIFSSRPDPSFHSWNGWEISTIAPLTQEQACELVEKASFHADAKKVFIKRLKDDLYASHESFLSNPLLLSIMLLTYEHDADIPTKLSVFYSRAYDALFTQHDALKGDFQRARKTNLDITDFAKLFSAFSFLTYLDRKFTFGLTYATERVKIATQLCSFDVHAESYLDDSKRAVCLLVEEGLDISFTHRSFQEYFAARYIAGLPEDAKRDSITKLASLNSYDSVIDLLYEQDQDCVNNLFLISAVEKQLEALGAQQKISAQAYYKIITSEYIGIGTVPGTNNWGMIGAGRKSSNLNPLFFAIHKWLGPIKSEDDKGKGFLSRLEKKVGPPHTQSSVYKFNDKKNGKKILAFLKDEDWYFSIKRLRKIHGELNKTRAKISSKDALLKSLLNTKR